MESFCPTCGLDFDNCQTCECPDDAKCLMLCEQMHGGKCPHYPYSDDENDDGFQIFVKNLTGKTLTFDVKPTDTIDNLKGQIKGQTKIKDKFWLVTGGKQLEDNRIVSYYKIEKSSTLHMLRWLKGGGKVLIFSWKSFL